MRLFLGTLGVFTAFLGLPGVARAEWVWPLQGELITTYHNGDDPYAGGQHRGIDIAGPVGARVIAATGGEVRFAGTAGSSGLTVSVRTGDGRFDTSYLHLSSISIRAGQLVSAGDTLGEVGTSGSRSTSEPHLHFGVREAGTRHAYRNPLDFLPPRSVPPAPDAPQPTPAPEPTPSAPAPARSPIDVPASRRVPAGERAPRRVPAGERAPRSVPARAPRPVSLGEPERRHVPVGEPALRGVPAADRAPRHAPARLRAPVRVPLGRAAEGAAVGGPATAGVLGAAEGLAADGGRAAAGRADGPDIAAARAPLPGLAPGRSQQSGQAHSRVSRSHTVRAAEGSGPDIGWIVACVGLLAAAAILGLTEDGRKATRKGHGQLVRLLRPLTGRG